MKMLFFQGKGYYPVVPRPDGPDYQYKDRIIMYHGDDGPIIRWADSSWPVAGWVIGVEA